jgi:kinesin family protein 13
MEVGNTNRTIGSTLMNQSSSRAHTVISIHLKIKENGMMK